jgi:hypothetical protein
MRDAADTITRTEFVQAIRDNIEDLKLLEKALGYETDPDLGLVMADDWLVSYHRSAFRGTPCVYFVWSAVEYIFV